MISTNSTKIKNSELLNNVESTYLKVDLPNIRIGDTLKLGIEIKEGEKTRIQAYEGVVISKKVIGLPLFFNSTSSNIFIKKLKLSFFKLNLLVIKLISAFLESFLL